MVEAEIEGEEDKNDDGDGLCQTAVEIHGLVDPVTVAQVPDETTEIAKSSSLAKSKWVSVPVISEERSKQG